MTYKDKDTLVYFFIEHYFQYGGSAFSIREMTYYGSEFSYPRVKKTLAQMISENKIFSYKKGSVVFYKNKTFTKPVVEFSESEFEMIKNLDNEMTFGTEIEFGCKVNPDAMLYMLEKMDLIHGISGNGVSLNRNNVDYETWFLTIDPSISVATFNNDYEIVSPIIRTREDVLDLKKMMAFLKRLEKVNLAKQDTSCGGHVHHGGIQIPMGKAITFLEASQDAMNKLVSKDRVYSENKIKWYKSRPKVEAKRGIDSYVIECYYCKPVVKEAYYKQGKIDYQHDKYINFRINNYLDNGTVEFRQHEATFFFKNILAWVIVGQCTLKAAKKEIEQLKEKRPVFDFLDFIGVGQEVQRYYGFA